MLDSSGQGSGLLSGAAVRGLFVTSGLENRVLLQIWDLADRHKRHSLDRDDFLIALRLVALAQNSWAVSWKSMLEQQEIPLPVFEGHTPEPQTPAVATVGEPRYAPTSQVGSVTATSPRNEMDPWHMSAQQEEGYDKLFHSVDTSGVGFVSGAQAQQFFLKSQLETSVLARIWDLSDLDLDHRLSPSEWAIAMHLIMGVKRSLPLPVSLPACLLPGPAVVPVPAAQQQNAGGNDPFAGLSNADTPTLNRAYSRDSAAGVDTAQTMDPSAKSRADDVNSKTRVSPTIPALPAHGSLNKAALQSLLEQTRSRCRDVTARADTFRTLLARAEEKADLQDSLEIKRQSTRLHRERLQEQQLLLEDTRKQLRVRQDFVLSRQEAIGRSRAGLGRTAGSVEVARKARLTSEHESVMRREQLELFKLNLQKVQADKSEHLAAVEVQKARLEDLNRQQQEVRVI
jgi:hypothetical protein